MAQIFGQNAETGKGDIIPTEQVNTDCEISSSNDQSLNSAEYSIMDNRRTFSARFAYLSVVILCFINLLNYMDRFTLAGVLTDVKSYYSLNNSKAGLLQTSFVLSYMITAPIFGYLGDRYSRRLIIASGLAFWSVTTFLGSIVPSDQFPWFMLLRALVGIGEASYSTIAPTLIGDLFAGEQRTKMLSLFYFAIPVGSGMGYIVGSKVAEATGHWYWALRITPGCGILSVFLTLFVLKEPPRGEAEGGASMRNTNVFQDIIEVLKIPSFVWETLGFTSVTFSVGALAWWVPDFLVSAMEYDGKTPDKSAISLIFGVITCIAGIAGVLLGTLCASKYRKYNPRADPLICAYSMLCAAPFVFASCLVSAHYISLAYVLVFIGVTLLCMNWVLVTDILLYVVIPTRRAMAAAIQITLSHALGDACSPYIVGLISDALYQGKDSPMEKFKSMQYALFVPVFVLLIGAACFFVNSFFIVEDKDKCKRATQESSVNLDVESVILLKDPTQCGSMPVQRLSNHAEGTFDHIYSLDDSAELIA